MKYLIIIISFFIFSCENVKDSFYVCSCAEQQKANEFLSKNIKGANNMSDEEMEDVIEELTRSAIKLNCHQEIFYRHHDNSSVAWDDERNKLDSCESVIEHVW